MISALSAFSVFLYFMNVMIALGCFQYGMTALVFASKHDHVSAVKVLLEHDAQVDLFVNVSKYCNQS